MHVEVPLVPFTKMTSQQAGEDSASIRERVTAARTIQHRRLKKHPTVNNNAAMESRLLKKHCALSAPTLDLLRQAMEDLHLSARAYDRILKVARTIADLAHAQDIDTPHIAEAIQYRSLDRQIWA
jgi:magnesium chelatase family protein